RRVPSLKAGRSTRSSGGYPISANSPQTSRAQSQAGRGTRIFFRLPATSPAGGLIFAGARGRGSGKGEGELRGEDAPARRQHHLIVNPPVGFLHAVTEPDRRRPAHLPLDLRVVAAASADAFRRTQVVAPLEFHAGDALDDVEQLIDGHELVAADVERLANRA